MGLERGLKTVVADELQVGMCAGFCRMFWIIIVLRDLFELLVTWRIMGGGMICFCWRICSLLGEYQNVPVVIRRGTGTSTKAIITYYMLIMM